ncbi:MAG TPA: MFS transporter, partial [Symbiobacteriaceae bacterium]|nr:MFS transporter [Symbiobacteriaceae bacterium]
GRAFGLNQTATSTGFALGPLLGGFIATWAGARWAFVASAALFGLAALWMRFVVTPRIRQNGAEAA